jgi:hypothetical protein
VDPLDTTIEKIDAFLSNTIREPHAYDLDIDSYIKFLDKGVEAFNAKKETK